MSSSVSLRPEGVALVRPSVMVTRSVGEQREELRPEPHGVDDQEPVASEYESDEFEQVAGLVGADDEDLGRVAVGVDVGGRHEVGRCVCDLRQL